MPGYELKPSRTWGGLWKSARSSFLAPDATLGVPAFGAGAGSDDARLRKTDRFRARAHLQSTLRKVSFTATPFVP